MLRGGLANPTGLAVDASGNLYVSEEGNDLVQRIAPDGTITTIAGNGTLTATRRASRVLDMFLSSALNFWL